MERVQVLAAGTEAEKLLYNEVSSYGTDYGKRRRRLIEKRCY